ncbi:MAG TPA: sugar transferase [Vicinamibacterales bacterium]|nr:sugar transferase [Vicinamibacterales bacterium]
MRRLGDLAGATAGVLVFAPFMAVISAAVWLDDGGPILFRQTRVGVRRRPFTILKFRTMRNGEVTRVGRVLRATGLDEIAQFFNIVRGDMSAVGPRPLTEADVQRLGWGAAEFDFRWDAKPGLTGLAQIAGTHAAAESLALDREYLARRTVRLDLWLIALSFAVNAFGKTRVRAFMQRRRAPRANHREKTEKSGRKSRRVFGKTL